MLTVVTGAPCSGKSTYVRARAQPGDIVIDFDVLAQALGSPHPHDHNGPIRHVTILARRAAIAAAIGQHRSGHTVWIVDSAIGPERLRTYMDAHARMVVLDVDTEELHRRAGHDARPPVFHRLIDEWHAPEGISTGVLEEDGSRAW